MPLGVRRGQWPSKLRREDSLALYEVVIDSHW